MKDSTIKNFTRTYARRIAGAAAAAVLGLASTASAAFSDGTPTQVEYIGSSSQLYIQVNAINFIGQTASPGCSLPANSADSVKIWEAQAQAAFLSGKRVRVYYNACNGNSYVSDVVLMN